MQKTVLETNCKLHLVIGFLLFLGGCSTPLLFRAKTVDTRPPEIQYQEGDLFREVELKIKLKHDAESIEYLHQLAKALGEVGAIKIAILQEPSIQWNSFVLPPGRIFLSKGLLKKIEYENQLAGLIAFEMSHLGQRHLTPNLREKLIKQGIDVSSKTFLKHAQYFGDYGLLRLSVEQEESALKAAVGFLYRAGYDPRGIISLLKLFSDHPAQSPFHADEIDQLTQKVWQEIAIYPPLRNPIIRTKLFFNFQKRIQRL